MGGDLVVEVAETIKETNRGLTSLENKTLILLVAIVIEKGAGPVLN
jgi:hypothetical protein